MKHVFHDEALKEYAEAAMHYKKISRQLGRAFVEEVERSIDKIQFAPETWIAVEENIRRHLLRKFPYGIYYSIEKTHILIIAVMHLSRKPGYWTNRIDSK